MRKIFVFILAICLGSLLHSGCRKKNGNGLSPIADSLAEKCIHPFVGPGDSSHIYFPTAFTPNGDGINDIYRLVSWHPSFTSYRMTIYDTTGILVFETTDPTRSWFGTDTATGMLSTKHKFYVEVGYTTLGGIAYSAGTYVFLLSSPHIPTSYCVTAIPADSALYEFPDQFDSSGFIPSWGSNEMYCN